MHHQDYGGRRRNERGVAPQHAVEQPRSVPLVQQRAEQEFQQAAHERRPDHDVEPAAVVRQPGECPEQHGEDGGKHDRPGAHDCKGGEREQQVGEELGRRAPARIVPRQAVAPQPVHQQDVADQRLDRVAAFPRRLRRLEYPRECLGSRPTLCSFPTNFLQTQCRIAVGS